MFSMANGKLIRLHDDGTEEIIKTNNSSLTIGTSFLSDYHVTDSTSNPSKHLAYVIYKDDFGRVSTAAFAIIFH